MRLLARLRMQLARHPSLWWLAVGSVAVIVGVGIAGAVRSLEHQRNSWGERRAVWVAVDAAEPGEALHAEARDYPVAVVPADAAADVPAGATARQRVGAGEVVVRVDVDVGGTPGLVPAGWVAVPIAQRASVARVGDAVAAFANGVRLADGVVVARDEEQVVVAVPPEAAAAVAQAVPGGGVIVGLVGGDQRQDVAAIASTTP